jgi:PST family polysaccharide transporter
MIKRLLVNNGILIIQSAVSSIVPLYLLPHIIRHIGLGVYGQLAVYLSWANYAVFFVQYVFQSTGPRQLAQIREGESAYVIFTEIYRTKFLLLGFAVSVIAAIALAAPTERTLTPQLILLLLLPLGAALNSGWFLQTRGKFLAICVVSILGSCAAIALGLALVRDDTAGSIVGASIALSVGPLFVGAATFLTAYRTLNGEKKTSRRISIRHQLRDGWPLFFSQIASSLYGLSGPIVIAYLVGLESAGAYSMLERVVNPLMAVCMLTHTAAYPQLARLYLNQRAAYWRLLRIVVMFYLCCSAVVISIALIYRTWLLHYLFGQSIFHGANQLFGWALAWFFIGILGTALTGYLVVSGKQHQVWPLTLKILSISLLIGIPGTYIFGAWAWMAALVLAQTPVLLAGMRLWREERRNA